MSSNTNLGGKLRRFSVPIHLLIPQKFAASLCSLQKLLYIVTHCCYRIYTTIRRKHLVQYSGEKIDVLRDSHSKASCRNKHVWVQENSFLFLKELVYNFRPSKYTRAIAVSYEPPSFWTPSKPLCDQPIVHINYQNVIFTHATRAGHPTYNTM
jgi:hypothetical protein